MSMNLEYKFENRGTVQVRPVGCSVKRNACWYIMIATGVLLLAFGWLFPEERLFLMFIPVPIKARWFVLGYAVVELFLGVAQFSGDSIAHFAHLGGMLFGALLIYYWKRKGKLYS